MHSCAGHRPTAGVNQGVGSEFDLEMTTAIGRVGFKIILRVQVHRTGPVQDSAPVNWLLFTAIVLYLKHM